MSQMARAIVYLFCCLLMWTSTWADTTTDVSDALNKLRSEMASLQARLDRDLQKKDVISDELAAIERHLNTLRRSIRENEQSRLELEDALNGLRRQLSKLQASAQQRMADLSLLLLKGYPIGQHSTLKLLLNQKNPQQTARVLAYHQRLTQHGLSTLEELSADIARIDDTQKNLAEQAEILVQLVTQQREDLEQVRDLVQRRQQTLAAINRDIDESNSALARLLEDEERLSEVLSLAQQQSLDETINGNPPDILGMRGTLPMPARGKIERRYGQRRDGGHTWRGWFIEAESLAPVHAIASGRVVYANWLRGYGLLIIIDHQDQILSLYAHNDTLFFEVGDWVRQGEQIATAGPSQLDVQSDKSGVYFELRENGEPIDPAAWVDSSRQP